MVPTQVTIRQSEASIVPQVTNEGPALCPVTPHWSPELWSRQSVLAPRPGPRSDVKHSTVTTVKGGGGDMMTNKRKFEKEENTLVVSWQQ